jgi:hypothetical protein
VLTILSGRLLPTVVQDSQWIAFSSPQRRDTDFSTLDSEFAQGAGLANETSDDDFCSDGMLNAAARIANEVRVFQKSQITTLTHDCSPTSR